MTRYNPINDRIIDDILMARSEIESEKQICSKDEFLKGSFNKKIGNLTAMTFRRYISNILNYHGLNFKVSNSNAFIRGCPIEWDLIILKSNAEDINNTNVFDVHDVVAVLEFKTSGLTIQQYKDMDASFINQFNYLNYFKKEYNISIPFGYISLSESVEFFQGTKKYFDEHNNKKNTAFVFLDWTLLYNKDEKRYIEECNDFEKFIFDLLS